jgi:two-component system sensor histidine kinase RegB
MNAHRLNFSWLIKLRWGAIIGQVVIILLVDLGMGLAVPHAPLFALIALEAASNLACMAWMRSGAEVREWMLGLVMSFDVLLLTGLLYLTGGPYNPFSFLYLVHLALAAVVLSAVWTWTLVGLSLACFGALFFHHIPFPSEEGASAGHGDHLHTHVQGMWVAFGVAAGFIVYFVQRVTRALAARDAELAAAHMQTARSERLASLATLAAGAAHQLATPLSTIAVVAKELERQLERQANAEAAVADARLIREQVERCREILLQLAADAGESTGEPPVEVGVDELLQRALGGVSGRERVIVESAAAGEHIRAPIRLVAQAIRAVLRNALDASTGQSVWVRAAVDDGRCRIEVRDRGPGMTADVLQRAGEPFFTTKGPDRGMGLGLFLTRSILEQMGGSLELESKPGAGTTAVLSLPAGAALQKKSASSIEIRHPRGSGDPDAAR